MKSSQIFPLRVGVVCGTLIATGFTSVDVQALVPDAKSENRSLVAQGLVEQARTADDLLRQVSEFLGVGEYQEAITTCDQVLKLKPNSFMAWYWRGYALSHIERYEEAIASFDQVLKIKPNHILALKDKGKALYNLKRYSAVVETCDRALNLDADDYQAWSWRGLALYRLNRTTEAIASLEKSQNH